MKTLPILFALIVALPLFAEKKPNILFIAIDDLRPELGCYGSPVAQSPHLDKLASQGRLFERAYCQQAICHPSRTSLLSGTRPDTNGITHNFVKFRDLNPDMLTIPQHFQDNGYETVFTGKIFHQGTDPDEAGAWTRSAPFKKLGLPKPKGFALPENLKLRNQQFKEMFEKYGEAAKRGLSSGPAYECADVEDHVYGDGYNTLGAIAALKDIVAEDEKPFFLALGFKKPHLNFVAPKKYWDLYDRDSLPLSTQSTPPQGGATMGLHASFELRTRQGIPKEGDFDEDLSKTLLHAYLACVSYVDAQVGLMLAALEESGAADNTIVIVWGDHGWHLGEMGIWGKATNYEISTRVPFIIRTPAMKEPGVSSGATVELLDIFPTLCDLTQTSTPDHLEGRSLTPLLEDPAAKWNHPAVSQFPNPALREWAANPLSDEMRETFFGPLIKEVEDGIIAQMGDKWDRDLFENHLMGYTLRTPRYRLVEWRDHRDKAAPPIFAELFDHQSDPTETKNVVAENPDVAARLSKRLTEIIAP